MKRSEMLQKIWDDLIGTSQEANFHEQILDTVEKLGMIPPSIENPNFQGGWNIHTYPMYVNEWEPEDE